MLAGRRLNEEITLQVLDLYYHFSSENNVLISPYGVNLKDHESGQLFHSCFCSDFCFNHNSYHLKDNNCAAPQNELRKLHPCSLYKMSKDEVKRLPGFKMETVSDYGVYLIFELDCNHFISKYMVLRYSDKLESIGFAEDILRFAK